MLGCPKRGSGPFSGAHQPLANWFGLNVAVVQAEPEGTLWRPTDMPPNTGTAMSPPEASGSGRSWMAPLAAGLLVILLLGGVTLTILSASRSGAGAGDALPMLRLSPASGAVEMAAPESRSGREHYRLAGPLPAGRPDPAPVYRFDGGTVPVGRVRQLARALGMPENPHRSASGWQLFADHRVLTVEDGGNAPWRLGLRTVTADTPVKCVREPCPTLPGATTSGGGALGGRLAPPPAVAERIAADALHALGLPAKDLSTTTSGQLAEVRAPRPVDGRNVHGFDTAFSIGGDRKVHSAHGWLGQPRRGPAYPLVTTAEAFRRLQAQPFAEIALCRPQVGGGCGPAPQVRITGAKLGLMMATETREPLLTPAWLFTLAEPAGHIPVVAVKSRYLRPSVTPESAGPLPKSRPSFHNPASPPSARHGSTSGGGPPGNSYFDLKESPRGGP